MSFASVFACSWHCSHLSRVLGFRSLAGFFTGSWVPIPGCFTFFTAPSARVFIKQLSTSHSESRLPIHGWIQPNFDACDVTGFRNTHRPHGENRRTPPSAHNRDVCCSVDVLNLWHLPTVLMTSDFDSSISRELRRNSSRHTHRLIGTLDVTPFLHGSDFILLADTSLIHSCHTPQSPMSVHATCLHLVRRTQALRPSLRLAHQAQLKRELHHS